MLREIYSEVVDAIDEAIDLLAKKDYLSFILLIGRADVEPLVKEVSGSECVIDYQLDRYHDITRESFYIRYLNRNYINEGFDYSGESGIDDLSIEMMVYTHLWESTYFLKTIYRFAYALSGYGYAWNSFVPDHRRYEFIKERVIEPLVSHGYKLGGVLQRAYKSTIRNAFAHSLYTVDVDKREVYLRPTSSPSETLSFEAFQKCFLYSVLLMNQLQKCLEMNHDIAAKKNTAITKPFLTPDGVKVQIIAETIKIGRADYPRFRIIKVPYEEVHI